MEILKPYGSLDCLKCHSLTKWTYLPTHKACQFSNGDSDITGASKFTTLNNDAIRYIQLWNFRGDDRTLPCSALIIRGTTGNGHTKLWSGETRSARDRGHG